MKEKLKISVFIPTLNRAKSLRKCLESITEQTYKNYEVVIVDGGSTDDTKEVVNEFSNKFPIIFTVMPGGLIPQANVGWQVATGDIVTRTDDDVVATPDWLSEIAETFGSNGMIGGVTGPTIIPKDKLAERDLTFFNQKMLNNSSLFWRLLSKLYFGYFLENQPLAVSKFFRSGAFSLGANYQECLSLKGLMPADHLEACNSSIRRTLIEQAGGYDPKYIGIGEYHEPDLAFKVKKLGYKLVFNPKAVLYHCPSTSGVFKARPQAYGRSQNFILFYFRHIKPNTPDKLLRFGLYLMFINVYWTFKFTTTKNFNQLGGLLGTVVGLIKYLPELPNHISIRKTAHRRSKLDSGRIPALKYTHLKPLNNVERKVTIFIPTFNRCKSLKNLLESLLLQTYKNFEIIVADGGSSDGTKELIKSFYEKSNIIYFQQQKEGILGAANEAVEKANGEIFVRTDDDVVVSKNWLKEIVQTFENDEVGGVTGPTIIPKDSLHSRDLTHFNEKMRNGNDIFWKTLSYIYHGYFLEGQPLAVSKFFRCGAFSLGSNYEECLDIKGLREVDTLEACNWSCRRKLLLQFGGFDEKYLKGLSDYHEADAAYKIKNCGYKLVFNPKAVLYHCPSTSGVFKARPQAYGRSQNFILFYFRHIKPNTPDKLLRFGLYLMFINVYWTFKFTTTKNFNQLGGLLGTVVGLIKYSPELLRSAPVK